MMVRGITHACLLTIATFLVTLGPSSTVCRAQTRDHLTPQEAEVVREAQVLDHRIDAFIRAIDRRMLVLTGGATAASEKQLKKEAEKWGELPAGTRGELIGDIAKILSEAITNIDDVNARDEKNPLIGKALRKLATAATRILDQLKPMQAQAKNDLETNSFELLSKHAEEIVEAAGSLPNLSPAEEKKTKGKN
jgi:hypothetical protein